jgi:poly-gamma-glutamate synthesis protein (capsule biosynthesis protein)
MTGRFTLAVTGQSLIKHDIRDIDAAEFRAVQNILRKADLSFTNFEGTILGDHGGWPLKGSFFGCSRPIVLDALAEVGFGALSLSNNHAFDLGPSGVLATLDEVERRRMLRAGIGRDHRHASQAGRGVVGINRIAMVAMDGGPGPDLMYAADGDELTAIRDKVGYTAIDLSNDSQPNDPPFVDPIDELALGRTIFKRAGRFGRNVRIDDRDMARNLQEIASAASEGYLVVAYLHHHHWASDWYKVPEWVGSIARRCIDAGAAMFLSHGAPVLQPLEIYNGRPIFYSLGNFIFHVPSKSTWHSPEVWESVIGVCSFEADNRLVEIEFHPVVIGGEEGLSHSRLEERLAPHIAVDGRANRILTRFQAQSAELGTRIKIEDNIGILRL